MFSSNNKSFFYKASIFIIGFLVILVGYFFLLNYYKNKILVKIEEINFLKTEAIQFQINIEKSRKLQVINNLVQQKTGKDLKTIVYELQEKLNRDFEATKNLIIDKLTKENWQIEKTNFQENEKIINFVFLIPENDYNKFSEFLFKESIIGQIKGLKIDKLLSNGQSTKSFYQIDLLLEIKTK